tara:strand:- start:178 stop:408 length:231 start_codon:yes stop_codon:yes gene_type:complete
LAIYWLINGRKWKVPKFTVDAIEYNTEDLNEQAQKTYQSLQYTLLQLKKIETEVEIYKVAHRALAEELRKELAKNE